MRLKNRSMVNGSNAKINENRYSSLRNSPSGRFLMHPNSKRVPDHPVNKLVQDKKQEDSKMINPSNSLTNIIQARNFISATEITDNTRNSFNQRSMSL